MLRLPVQGCSTGINEVQQEREFNVEIRGERSFCKVLKLHLLELDLMYKSSTSGKDAESR